MSAMRKSYEKQEQKEIDPYYQKVIIEDSTLDNEERMSGEFNTHRKY